MIKNELLQKAVTDLQLMERMKGIDHPETNATRAVVSALEKTFSDSARAAAAAARKGKGGGGEEEAEISAENHPNYKEALHGAASHFWGKAQKGDLYISGSDGAGSIGTGNHFKDREEDDDGEPIDAKRVYDDDSNDTGGLYRIHDAKGLEDTLHYGARGLSVKKSHSLKELTDKLSDESNYGI